MYNEILNEPCYICDKVHNNMEELKECHDSFYESYRIDNYYEKLERKYQDENY